MDAPAQAPLAPAAPRRTARVLRWALALLVLAASIAALLLGSAWWALSSPSGSAWLLGRVPGLAIEAPSGALLGDFAAARAELAIPGSGRLRLTDLRWQNLRIGSASAGPWLRIRIDRLEAARVEWQGAPSTTTTPAAPPADLGLPFELDVAALHIGEVRYGGADTTPILDVDGSVHLGAELGSVHSIDRLSLRRDRLLVSGSAQIASSAPMQLEARLTAAQAADPAASGPAWSASVNAAGPLASPLVQATVRAPALAGRPAQTLDARGTVRPFAAWPLGALEFSAKALDLSALDPALPRTSLSGNATARSEAMDRPSVVVAHLENAAAGRWNEQKLPLRSIDIELRARADALDALDIRAFGAELGDAAGAAGRIEGKGRWTRERWNVDATIAELRPARLDARAPALTVGGTLAIGSTGGAGAKAAPVDVRGTLDGQLEVGRVPRAVRLRIDAGASAERIEIRAAEARAGESTASLSGSADRRAAGWHVDGRATLVEFDPTLWWPGPADSAWRRGPHRLNAQGRFDLAVPDSIASLPGFAALAALRGDVDATLDPSQLAGIPVRGEAVWHNADGARGSGRLALDAGGNTIRLEGRIGLDAAGSADAWDATVEAPALAKLDPLWRLAGLAETAVKGAPGPSGTLAAKIHVEGRWPAVRSDGEVSASGLRLGSASVHEAQARWGLGTARGAPVEIAATASAAGYGAATLESVRLQLKGTVEAHRLEAQIESRGLPPAWTDALQPAAPAPPAASRSLAILQADGALIGAVPDRVVGWRGRIGQLDVRNAADGSAAWAHARDLDVEARWGDGPAHVVLQPGRLELLGAGLRWTRFDWQGGSGAAPMRFDVDAALDPLPIAPILRRVQPDFGWGGDLTVGGRIVVRSAPAVSADVVFERRTGDLSVTDEIGTRRLGLTDLRLGLAAADGVWSFTQALAGTTLGVASGALVARTAPGQTWPSARTPIEGVVEIQVADLGTWGTWVPAGWRLGGDLRASASLAGRIGAPEYTGSVTGHGLSVRNFLEGVNVGDGDVAVALQGTTARIERFSARAGTGTVSLEGDARFGEAPQAQLRLNASRFQVLGRVDRRIVASGSAQVRLDRETVAVDGRFTVDEGLIDFSRGDAPSLGSDVQVVRRRPAPPPVPGSAEAVVQAQKTAAATPQPAVTPMRKVALDLEVGMGQQLRIRGRGLDAGLRGDLRITSPGNRLAVNGTVYTVDGTYVAYGQKLAIDRGQLTFSGAVENPRLDIEATRPNLDIRVGVAVTGTALSPRVRLFSEPELAEMDKLSWLVLGRASEGLGRTDTALLQRAALALLSGEGPSTSDQLIRTLGLDEISVRQSEGDVRDTVVSLGKQLSRRWYVGYERGLNATAGSWQLIYRIARRFTLRAQSGADNSVDVIWTWRWQ